MQVLSYEAELLKKNTTWREGGLFIEHLIVHIQARHCMGCDIWLCTYRHVIAWAVTSDCAHTGTSLHGLWHLIVHIRARCCMGYDIWLCTYRHVIAWTLWRQVLLLFYKRILISNIGEWEPIISWNFRLPRWFFDQKILLKKRSMLHRSECYLSSSCLWIYNWAVL